MFFKNTRAYHDFLSEKKTLYEKPFVFQSAHSTEHAVLQLSNQMINSLNEKEFALEIFIEFSKASDKVDQKALIKKLEKYLIKHHYLDLFESFLNSPKQYIRYSEGIPPSKERKCGVSKSSYLRPFLFLIFLNNL